ncbi:MAG: sigma-54-dependent transcriptional regulator [Myxococcota bacterium]
MSRRRVLIIDDEKGIRSSLALILEDEGYAVRTAADADEALEHLAAVSWDFVLCDVRMPGRSGLELLPDLIEAQPEATVVMMSAYGDVEQALEAVRRGAYDYLAKPFQPDELLLCLRKAEEREGLKRENRLLRQELRVRRSPRRLIAISPVMKQIDELIQGAAEYKTTVLITGESGVGKEIVARSLHERSERASNPFVPVNCAAIPETLIESELFGHTRGAFTGAEAPKAGLFREADGGTLFLDEVGELPLMMQVKLLRVLQEEEVRPVGESRAIHVDVRIVAATARELEREVAARRFREDLFYRLNVFRIHVPPLRERPEDIPALAAELLEHMARRLGRRPPRLGPEVMEALSAHPWLGNVRELENTLERAVILCKDGRLTPELLPFGLGVEGRSGSHARAEPLETQADLSIKRQSRRLEERLIRAALEKTGGVRTQAAQILEISLRALQYKLKEYAIEPLNPGRRSSDSEGGS